MPRNGWTACRCAARDEPVGSLDRTSARRRRPRVVVVVLSRESRTAARLVTVGARVKAHASVSGIVGFPSRFPFSCANLDGGGKTTDPVVFSEVPEPPRVCTFSLEISVGLFLSCFFLKKMSGTRGFFPGGSSDFLVLYFYRLLVV